MWRAEAIAALGRACRRRLDAFDWSTRGRIVVSEASDGSWTVEELGDRLATFSPAFFMDRPLQSDAKRKQQQALKQLEASLFGGEDSARRLARAMRRQQRSRSVAEHWPEHVAAKVEDDALVARLRSQWDALGTRALRKCSDPKCAVPGGRYFIAQRNSRDCPYCRRSRSKSTRWRHRQRESSTEAG